MTQTWTVVIADDDELARQALRGALAAHSNFRIVGEAADGSAAVSLLDQLRPDLALLDVAMPGLGGIDVLRALRPREWPVVVFLCGNGALGDFEGGTIPYLVRPFGEEELDAALARARRLLEAPAASHRAPLEEVLADARSPMRMQQLPIRHNGRIEVLDLADVDWISAAGNYVEIHADGRRLLHRITLKELVDRIDARRFARIHRSTVVNVERVSDLEPTPQGDWKLSLDTGDRLRLSRRYREALDRLHPSRHHHTNGYSHA